jgi:hypothetical protein
LHHKEKVLGTKKKARMMMILNPCRLHQLWPSTVCFVPKPVETLFCSFIPWLLYSSKTLSIYL